jgi:hypothetical protein
VPALQHRVQNLQPCLFPRSQRQSFHGLTFSLICYLLTELYNNDMAMVQGVPVLERVVPIYQRDRLRVALSCVVVTSGVLFQLAKDFVLSNCIRKQPECLRPSKPAGRIGAEGDPTR